MPQPTVFLTRLSGPAAAGKTTLAHLLSHIFSPHVSLILHGDDFCKEFDQIPTVDGYLDADGPAGVDFTRMGEILDYVKVQGTTPEGFNRWQADVIPGQDRRALRMIDSNMLEDLREQV